MDGIACGLIIPPIPHANSPRARALTVSWLRWNYFGDIFEDGSVDNLLTRVANTGVRYCLVQGYGHILTEHAGPNGGKAISAFDALRTWAKDRTFIFAGVADRCLLVDLEAWQQHGKPRMEQAKLMPFGPELAGHMVDLQPDLSEAADFFNFLNDMSEKAGRGVFVLNYESYDDVEVPVETFQRPLSTLYCVAAGLKPNRILHTHGITDRSRVVFFDYSEDALDFRRRLDAQWDGSDYPAYLRKAFTHRPNTHYYLWPGASPETMDWQELDRLWALELDRWGGANAFKSHWQSYQTIQKEYLPCNILSPQPLLERIVDEAGSAIWWSNAFCTIYSATHHSLEEKQSFYEHWINHLADKAPALFLYGSDHSNCSVNGMNAHEYREAYFAQGGDPLMSRKLHRLTLRF
ncbi:hypothetical protein FB480_105130 [Agrobacterium vitis]|nr:hypothetical protein FB480_105130 [Agrobacterium vitis]